MQRRLKTVLLRAVVALLTAGALALPLAVVAPREQTVRAGGVATVGLLACAECAYNLAKEMYEMGLWSAREAIDFVLNWED